MSNNPELEERPDHGHYPACSGRLSAINHYCNRLFIGTLIISAMLFMITMLGIRLNVISWIPSLFGRPEDLLPYFLRLVSCLSFIVLAALGCGKYKFCNVVLSGIYLLLTIVPILTCKDVFDVMVAVMGAVGLDLSFKSFSYYRDYNQLRETEGFPHFNQRYIEQVEFSEYRSKHMNNYSQYDQMEMNRVSYENNTADIKAVPNENAVPFADNTPIMDNTSPHAKAPAYPKSGGNSSGGYDGMPELDIKSSAPVSAPSGRFTPKDIKAGAISDSPVKLKYKGGN